MLRMIFFEREAPPSEKVHAEVRALGFLLFVLLASLLLSGCGGSTSERVVGGEHVAPGDTGDTGCAAMEREVIDYSVIPGVDEEGRLQDIADIYTSDNGIINLRVAVLPPIADGKCTADDGFGQEDYTGCTLADVESDIYNNDDFDPFVRVHFQADDYPDDGHESNATLSMRGNSTRVAPQKSFRIKLDKGLPKWRGQRNLQINKHPNDPMRITNKLSFDLFQNVPNFISLRTEFVHLHVLNEGDAAATEQSFGLFTHVERPNDNWLESRGQDKGGALWKTYNMKYEPPEFTYQIFNDIDSKEFKNIIKPIGANKDNKDKGTLLEMLAAVNDCATEPRIFYPSDFAPIFNHYFHADNFRTWLAINVLLSDTYSGKGQNTILYRPTESSQFYFLPWDYDGGWYDGIAQVEELISYPRWTKGVSNWWAMPLVRRYLQMPDGPEKLTEKINELVTSAFLPEAIQAQIDSYPLEEISAILSSSPDSEHILHGIDVDMEPEEVRNSLIESLSESIVVVKERYEDNLNRPMPFEQFVEIRDSKMVLLWQSSYDIQGDDLFYDVTLASSAEKNSINAFCDAQLGSPVLQLSDHIVYQGSVPSQYGEMQKLELDLDLEALDLGHYYLQVVVRDDKGYCQTAYDAPHYHNNAERFGILPFYYDGHRAMRGW